MIKKIQKILKIKKHCRDNNIILGKNVVLDKNTVLEGNNYIGNYTIIHKSVIGYGSYLGTECRLNNANIGRFCSIGSDVKIIMGHHPSTIYVSTHPAFYSMRKQAGFTFVQSQKYDEFRFIDEKKEQFVSIGNDVWIGEGVKILEGIKIGDGAIVGAYSLVTKDVEPYSIVAGVPAKKIKNRFKDNEIQELKNFKWWHKDISWIHSNVDLFDDIEKFIYNIQKDSVLDE